MAVYLDASAVVKLVIAEQESEALRRFVRRRAERISSALSRVEVIRAVRLHGGPATNRAKQVLARLRLLRLDDMLLAAASELDPGILRSLDAIHVASAQAIGSDLTALVSYDRPMLDAARLVGLPVRSPGSRLDGPPRRRRAAPRPPRAQSPAQP
ncbi:MAG: type II toxin-antitoxin system VapC family toxin [Myxococcales bacterium]|nr:type II toxin-antitoxin system VapC family toxin [Myxococcales bacterium]